MPIATMEIRDSLEVCNYQTDASPIFGQGESRELIHTRSTDEMVRKGPIWPRRINMANHWNCYRLIWIRKWYSTHIRNQIRRHSLRQLKRKRTEKWTHRQWKGTIVELSPFPPPGSHYNKLIMGTTQNSKLMGWDERKRRRNKRLWSLQNRHFQPLAAVFHWCPGNDLL